MEYLPILFTKRNYEFSLNTEFKIKSSPEKLTLLLEPLVFHFLCILNGSQQSDDFFNRLYKTIGENVDVNKDCEYLGNYFKIDPEQLVIPVQCFHSISTKLNKHYTIDNLILWIQSIQSKSILESYHYIKNQDDIPAFVLFDLMLRNPQYKEEFILQKDIWFHNLKPFALQRLGQTAILKSIVDNLVYYSIMFEISCLRDIIDLSFKFFKSSRTGVHVQLGDEYINEMIWNIAFYSSKYRDIEFPMVANAQETLVTHLTSIDKLSLKGYMGITTVISHVSRGKAERLLKVAERKFDLHNATSKEMVSYYIAQLCLADTPEEVVQVFNVATKKYDHSSKLWLVFIRRLNMLGLLDVARAKMILNKLISSKVSITSDMITELLRPVKDLFVFEDMIQSVDSKTSMLFLNKYIQLLYSHDSTVPVKKFRWDEETIEPDKKVSNIDDYVVTILQKHQTISIYHIGLILEGQAKRKAVSQVFQLYKSKLLDKQLSPNKQCLGALISAAYHDGEAEAWNGLVTAQAAIHEFQQHVRTNELGLIPSENLWKKYITLLDKYQQMSELSKIIKWWEDLNYNPSKRLLLTLLAALPIEISERHIKHHESANSSHDWQWPSINEFKGFIVNRNTA
ncbi:hypothetical protein G210_0272 [Candida maltosa Xu316]|uniref:Uncharacterized protein n=1 Tax=Candida maltosa (strain Xu316) TaxID=1245528 RepID=M3K2U7_CANMX|nr:hypothetical protein G210_0272 [Candida maltosa Xu316]